MPTAPATEAEEALVNFGGRIPPSLRRRVRLVAADQGITVQDVLQAALEEYTQRKGYGPNV